MGLDACDRGELSGEKPQQISGLLKFDNNSFKDAERELGVFPGGMKGRIPLTGKSDAVEPNKVRL
jgi:hypothetical protein